MRALRKTDDFSMWIWHGDGLNRWATAHQAQAVPAVGPGWKNLSSSINVCVIPRVCFTLLHIPDIAQAERAGDTKPRKSTLPP